MKFLSILLLILTYFNSSAQKEIKLEKLKDHVGDSVKVIGKVYGVKYLESAKNTPTFISIGAAYPNQLLTVVIWGDVRQQLRYKPEDVIGKAEIIIFGKVEEYKGRPQIVIRQADQLVFNHDEEVPADQIPPIEKKKGK